MSIEKNAGQLKSALFTVIGKEETRDYTCTTINSVLYCMNLYLCVAVNIYTKKLTKLAHIVTTGTNESKNMCINAIVEQRNFFLCDLLCCCLLQNGGRDDNLSAMCLVRQLSVKK